MKPRRVLIAMAALLGAAAVVFLVLGRPILAAVFAASTVAQVAAAVVAPRGRTLMTVVFTDVVNSTQHLVELGDEAWQRKFETHAARLRKELGRLSALAIKDLGDGFLTVFPMPNPTPSQVLGAALRLNQEARDDGLIMRTGIHAGECSIRGSEVRGLAVHIAARLMDAAAPGQVVISSSVRELLGGTALSIDPLGERELKGVGEPMRIYSVSDRPSAPAPS